MRERNAYDYATHSYPPHRPHMVVSVSISASVPASCQAWTQWLHHTFHAAGAAAAAASTAALLRVQVPTPLVIPLLLLRLQTFVCLRAQSGPVLLKLSPKALSDGALQRLYITALSNGFI